MDLKVKGLVALVTGSSRGLGLATARALSQEGAKVVINGRDAEKLAKVASALSAETGNLVFAAAGDVGGAGAQEVVDAAVGAFGGLDILICNAGGPPPGTFDLVDDAKWQTGFELTFMSNVRLIRAALPALRKSDHASVITITSLSVKQPIQGLLLSNSLRAGVVGLTKSLALELGGEGIRFNSILPGWTETERVVELMTNRAKNNGSSVEAELKKQSAESPFGRMATPEEFAAAAVFLASPRAAYITGTNLAVDGGMLKGTF